MCIHNKSHKLPLILGLNFAYIFPGVVYQPRHVFKNDDFGSKFCMRIPRSRYNTKIVGVSANEETDGGMFMYKCEFLLEWPLFG